MIDKSSRFGDSTLPQQTSLSPSPLRPALAKQIAYDFQNEGRFENATDEPMIVFRDRYDEQGRSLGVIGSWLEPGQRADGDAVLPDTNRDGTIDEKDWVTKVPNRKDGSDSRTIISILKGKIRTQFSGNMENTLYLHAAMLFKPDKYGEMTLPHFYELMGKKPLLVEGKPFYPK